MTKVNTWPRVLTWLAAPVGLLLGALLPKGAVGHDPSQVASSAGTPSKSASQPGKKSAVREPGPITLFLRQVADLPADKCAELARVHRQIPRQEIELEAIFRRWLTLEEPDKILKQLSDSGSEVMASKWQRAFFDAWAAVDERAAMDPEKHGEFTRLRALHAIQTANPDLAAYLKKPHNSLDDGTVINTALVSLGRFHPDLAKSLAQSDLPSEMKKTSLAAVAAGMAISDPRAAWDWARSLEGQVENQSVLNAVIFAWLKSDPQAAKEAWEAGGKPEPSPGYQRVFTMALRTFQDPGDPGNQLMLALHRDPFASVASLYKTLQEAGIDWSQRYFISPAVVGTGWYPPDAAAAAAEAVKLPEGDVRNLLLSSICNNWVSHDSAAALQFAEEQGLKSSYYESFKEQPTEELRQAVEADPEQGFAALFDREALPSDSVEFRQMNELAKEWIVRSPDFMATWMAAQSLPENTRETGDMLVDMLFRNSCFYWGKFDPTAAAEWVASLPAGPLKSRAWEGMERGIAEYSPALAESLRPASGR